METVFEVSFDSGTPEGAFSLRRQKVAIIDDERVEIGLPERRAVVPGDFDTVKEFAPDLLPIFQNIWTKELIKAWEESHPPIETQNKENPE